MARPLSRLRAIAGALGALWILAAAAAAAETWRPAPIFGGDVRSLAFDPGHSGRVLAGTSGGHVYRSDDGGETWRNAGAEVPFAGWVVGALRIDPNRPERLWAALWGIWGGGAVARSDDGGASWLLPRVASGDGEQIYDLALVPGSVDRLFAASRQGVLRSDDGGASWRRVGESERGLVHVASLYVDPARPETVIAGTWRRAFRSDDGGETWRGIFTGMALDTDVFSLHGVPERPGEIWASTCGWVYRGDALGERWTRFTSGFAERRTPSFAVLGGERLLAGTVAGAYLSTNRGASFRRTSPDDFAVLAIAVAPDDPGRVLLGTEGAGVWVSRDGGESFTRRPLGMRNVRVPALARMGDQVYAAVAHAGSLSGVYRSPDGGASFDPLPSPLPTVLALQVVDGQLLAATEAGLFALDGKSWNRVPELGESRVVALEVLAGRLVARTPQATFQRRHGRFERAEKAKEREVAPPSAPDARLDEVQRAAEGRRVHATGDPRFSHVIASKDGTALWDGELGRAWPLLPPFPVTEIQAALVVSDRLLLGSSGYGLWETRLPE